MKKRTVALLLSAVLISVCFTSCTSARIKVNNVKIDGEIYTYYQSYLEKDFQDSDLENEVKKSIVRYVTVNSEFAKRDLSLTPAQKAELSQDVNDIWHLFSKYYEEIGVSKQTIYKIEQSKQFEQSLLLDYYGENGVSPVSEEQIKAYFSENYASIRFVTGYLFNIDENGASVDMTDEQKNNTVTSFMSVASMINGGTPIEEAVVSLGENTEVHDSVVFSFSEGSFPEGFFNSVKAIETGKSSAISLGNYVFLVQRLDPFNNDFDHYNTYRTDCLNRMKGEEFAVVVDSWMTAYNIR